MKLARRLILAVLYVSGIANAADLYIDANQTAFVVVTQKTGLLSSFAHNHVVHAKAYDGRIRNLDDGELALLRVEIAVEDLEADDPAFRDAWFEPLVARHGILSEKPTDLSAGDRAKIREGMLAKDLLDAENHKMILGQMSDIRAEPTENSFGRFTHRIKMLFTIKSRPIYRLCFAKVSQSPASFEGDFVCELKLSDFGIEPPSMLLGAVGTKDEFHLVARIVAKAERAAE